MSNFNIILGSNGLEFIPLVTSAKEVILKKFIVSVCPQKTQNLPSGKVISVLRILYKFGTNSRQIDIDLTRVANQPTWSTGDIAGIKQAIDDINAWLTTGFNPSSVGQLWSWYKKSTGITLNGSNISQWSDNSGNARHLVQATPSKQPDGSHGTAIFGGDDDLEIPGVTNPASFTICLLVKPIQQTQTVFCGLKASASYADNETMTIFTNYGLDSDIAVVIGSQGVGTNITATKTDALFSGTYETIIVTYQTGDTTAKIFVNGELMYVTLSNGTITSTLATGTFYFGGIAGTTFSNFELLESIIYAEAISDANAVVVSDYLFSLVPYNKMGTIVDTDFTDQSTFNSLFTSSIPADTVITPSGMQIDGTSQPSVILSNYLNANDKWRISGTFVITGPINSTSYGFYFGDIITGNRATSLLDLTNTSSSGVVSNGNQSATFNTSGALKLISVSGDTLDYSFTKVANILISKYVNITAGPRFGSYAVLSTFMDLSAVVNRFPSSSANYGFYCLGGQYLVTRFKLESDSTLRPKYVTFGDSITEGFDAGSPAYRAIAQAVYNPNDFVALGGTAETTNTMVLRMQEVIKINPHKVIILASINDPGNSVSEDQSFINLTTMKTTFEGAGIEVIFCKLTPANFFDVTSYNNRLVSQFGGTNTIVDFYTTLKDPAGFGINSIYSSDGLHPNKAANTLMAAALVAAGIT